MSLTPLTDIRDANLRASAATRHERAQLLSALRVAPSAAAARERCARVIETRPTCLHGTYVHEILEVCRGVGIAGADQLQTAAGMFRAYTLAELPYGKACALVALLRLTPRSGGAS